MQRTSIHPIRTNDTFMVTIYSLILSYGGEVWSTSKSACGCISKVLVEAVNLAKCYNRDNRSMNTEVMLQEMDIPPMFADFYSKRMRTWAKWRHSRTWIAEFVRDRSKKKGTWSQSCAIESSKLLTSLQESSVIPTSQGFEHVASKRLARLTNGFSSAQHHETTASKVVTMQKYSEFGMAGSNGYLRHSILCNDLFDVNLLVRVRGNGFGSLW